MKRDRYGARGPAARKQKIRSHPGSGKNVHWSVRLFLLALIVPWAISIGPLRMSLYRIVLLVMVVPCLGMWRAGKAGRIRAADIALLLFSLWCTFSLIVNHGMGHIQAAGIGFIETVGPYLLARCYIRDADDFFNMVRLLFRIVLLLLPFAIVECISGQNIWRDLFAAVWPVHVRGQMPSRWGLTRVQLGFDHPILFGVCIGGILAPVYLVLGYQKNFFQRFYRTGIVGVLAFLSLSAGALIPLIVQGVLLSWNGLTRAIKSRWQILIALSGSIALAIELVANRSLLNIIVTSLVFEQESYWYRLFIWEYASASVLNHPLFGIGLNDWERPHWMLSSSIDNFWLVLSVSYGFPGSFLLLLTFLSIVLGLGLKKGLDDKMTAYRTAFLISMAAFFLAGWTVHFWDASYVFFLFFMGSGVWMLDLGPEERTGSATNRTHFTRRGVGPVVKGRPAYSMD